MDFEDKKIIEEFLKGDESSFNLLVNKYLKPVYNFLFQLVGDRAATDDIAQDTFVKAWKSIKKFDIDRSFKTWIFTIAKNTAYDYFKKKKTIPFSSFIDEDGNNKLDNISDDNIQKIIDIWNDYYDAKRKDILRFINEV